MIPVDNVNELTAKALDAGTQAHGVKLACIRPGKPAENAGIESVIEGGGDECLNANVLVSLRNARKKIEVRRIDDNEHRPYGTLGDIPPQESAEQTAQTWLAGNSMSPADVVYFLGKDQKVNIGVDLAPDNYGSFHSNSF